MKKLLILSVFLCLMSCKGSAPYIFQMEWHVMNESGKDVVISTSLIYPKIKIAAGESVCLNKSYCDYSSVSIPPDCEILWSSLAEVSIKPIFFRVNSENIENTGDSGLDILKEWTFGSLDPKHDFFNGKDWTRYDSTIRHEKSNSEIPLYTWVFTILPEDIAE